MNRLFKLQGFQNISNRQYKQIAGACLNEAILCSNKIVILQ